MIPEKHIQKAQDLAKKLANVDDNEVKKIYSFLCRHRQMSALHHLLKALPQSPFKDRSKSTLKYYKQMEKVIPFYLTEEMNVDDAIQILGWACRLLKYETLKTNKKEKDMKGGKAKTKKGGKVR